MSVNIGKSNHSPILASVDLIAEEFLSLPLPELGRESGYALGSERFSLLEEHAAALVHYGDYELLKKTLLLSFLESLTDEGEDCQAV